MTADARASCIRSPHLARVDMAPQHIASADEFERLLDGCARVDERD